MPTSRTQLAQTIEAAGLIAILRSPSDRGLVRACEAFVEGGLVVAEVPLTTPDALGVIREVADGLAGRLLIGAGSVLDTDGVKRAVDAGAGFIVSPVFKPELVEAGHRLGVPVIPGALTPTEVLTAWEAGADFVKLFPGHRLGGPAYVRELLGPLPQIKLVPTGGVTLENLPDWLHAGAVGLGVGSALIRQDLIDTEKWKELADTARRFVQAVKQARGGVK